MVTKLVCEANFYTVGSTITRDLFATANLLVGLVPIINLSSLPACSTTHQANIACNVYQKILKMAKKSTQSLHLSTYTLAVIAACKNNHKSL